VSKFRKEIKHIYCKRYFSFYVWFILCLYGLLCGKIYNICGGFMVIELWGFTVYSEYRKFGINFCCFEDVFTSNLGTTFTENIQKAVQIEPSPRKITKYVSNKIRTGAHRCQKNGDIHLIMFSMNFHRKVSIRFKIFSAWSA
jgi:hypothetical protein